LSAFAETFAVPGRVRIWGAPPGCDALFLARLAPVVAQGVVFVARDGLCMAAIADALSFFAPELKVLEFPAWDCLPYDRVSPNVEIASRRLATLVALQVVPGPGTWQIVLTTVAAVTQKVVPKSALAGVSLSLAVGDRLEPDALVSFLVRHGYSRAEQVTELGEYAVRGGILDVFVPAHPQPLRLDFFGDELESLRQFDPATQRTTSRLDAVDIAPVSEIFLDQVSIARFRSAYRALFGTAGGDDPVYTTVSEGRRPPGVEHWLPLFHPGLETLFDYVEGAAVVVDHQADDAREDRHRTVVRYYEARRDFDAGRFAAAAPYRGVPPNRMYIDPPGWDACLTGRAVATLSPFAAPEPAVGDIDAGGHPGIDFADARKRQDVALFDIVAERILGQQRKRRRVTIAAISQGSRDRLLHVLGEHGVAGLRPADSWRQVLAHSSREVGVVVFPLAQGFLTAEHALITEQDMLGDRVTRRARRRVRPENFLAETSALITGDLVVHVEHGVARYEGLETIGVDGAPHDCLRLLYAGGDKLYLPVENIDVISRYGSESEDVALDRLGGAAWQARKAKLKARIRAMAAELIKTAAVREVLSSPVMAPSDGAFDEFCARFPYTESDDQTRAIDDVLADLASGRPSDRLVCGDVGFGKTEVALRAAFVTAMEGKQVAVVVPTTLLSRQHYRTFCERFAGFPIRIGELSRFVSAKEAKSVKAELADGRVDVVVGTHALLASAIRFRDLGLVIVDEEQHFGVAHKEQLKRLSAEVHVLTLTATPIPRTMQLALSGVRSLSLISTPPIDRLAVRTFVLEFDPLVIREAILRERDRGGQTFYVSPRIEDLDELATMLAALVPEVNVVMAHGRMPARQLETTVAEFYDGRYNVLLSTNIIESGLDLPAVNTIVIHRADLFGLAQLYQLRGRVGRGKVRAYAYLTLPTKRRLTPSAEKRLSVMQALDALGAGFSLATHDLDIRGAGNLLGDEQSGHIREVGIELYQQMLQEAVAEARGAETAVHAEEWSPQITLGLSVLIPEAYVPDLGVRLGLYRRLAGLQQDDEIDAFAAELIDRFGPLPDEVKNLLEVIVIKQLSRRIGIDKVEAGPKGALISFRDNQVRRPEKIVAYVDARPGVCKLRPDQRLVYRVLWETPQDRLRGVRRLIADLARATRP
jgi:transcription-repair coupling factor (superfamily II helicase)